jgi:hypothetical protein
MIRIFVNRVSGLLLAACLGLTACGSDQGEMQGTKFLQNAATGIIKPRQTTAKPAPPVITQEMLAQVPGSLQLITLEGPDVWALVVPVAQNGNVRTWESVDKKTVSFRRGILVATRGIGADLISADVPSPETLAAGAGGHSRTYVTLDGLDRPVRQHFTCNLSVMGPDTVISAGKSYATRRIREDCSGTTGEFVNEYWFENSLNLRRSRQWANEVLQHIGTELLK